MDNTSSIVDLVNRRLTAIDGTNFLDEEGYEETERNKSTDSWKEGWGLGGGKFNSILLFLIFITVIYIAFCTWRLAKVRC